jgi:hypothetical protein
MARGEGTGLKRLAEGVWSGWGPEVSGGEQQKILLITSYIVEQ